MPADELDDCASTQAPSQHGPPSAATSNASFERSPGANAGSTRLSRSHAVSTNSSGRSACAASRKPILTSSRSGIQLARGRRNRSHWIDSFAAPAPGVFTARGPLTNRRVDLAPADRRPVRPGCRDEFSAAGLVLWPDGKKRGSALRSSRCVDAPCRMAAALPTVQRCSSSLTGSIVLGWLGADLESGRGRPGHPRESVAPVRVLP